MIDLPSLRGDCHETLWRGACLITRLEDSWYLAQHTSFSEHLGMSALDQKRTFRVVLGVRNQHTDPLHPLGLLRAYRKRPHSHRTVEKSD
jgi:hypothetical protein